MFSHPGTGLRTVMTEERVRQVLQVLGETRCEMLTLTRSENNRITEKGVTLGKQ